MKKLGLFPICLLELYGKYWKSCQEICRLRPFFLGKRTMVWDSRLETTDLRLIKILILPRSVLFESSCFVILSRWVQVQDFK